MELLKRGLVWLINISFADSFNNGSLFHLMILKMARDERSSKGVENMAALRSAETHVIHTSYNRKTENNV
jgi:hypothetical protein